MDEPDRTAQTRGMERLGELETRVQEALVPILGERTVRSVEVTDDPDDRDRVCVVVEVRLVKRKLPKDINLQIGRAASKALEMAGERRFPLVFGRFAAEQEIAA